MAKYATRGIGSEYTEMVPPQTPHRCSHREVKWELAGEVIQISPPCESRTMKGMVLKASEIWQRTKSAIRGSGNGG